MIRTSLAILLIATIVPPADARVEQRPGWIGLGYTYHRTDKSKPGWLYVQRLAPGGPAERAGLRAQDVITTIDGRPLRFANDSEVLAFFGRLAPKQQLVLGVVRQQKAFSIKVTAVEMSAESFELWKKNSEIARRRNQ